jgi:hypothetical protein
MKDSMTVVATTTFVFGDTVWLDTDTPFDSPPGGDEPLSSAYEVS